MAYEMGRTLVGYEVQKVLAAVDWFQATATRPLPVGVIGVGEGGRVALYAAAVDEPRSRLLPVACYVRPARGVHDEPLDRNVWGLLREFGDAEVARARRHPRHGDRRAHDVTADGKSKPTRTLAESGGPARGNPARAALARRHQADPDADAARERCDTARRPPDQANAAETRGRHRHGSELARHRSTRRRIKVAARTTPITDNRKSFDPAARHKRQFDQLVAYTQKLWRDSDATRKEFWKKADDTSLEAYEKSTEWYRDYFHTEVIGKLPEPTMPLNPRTRQVYDEKTWTGYEVMLDVYPDVFAYGILLLPKDLKPGEKRPVVVCQHGLEGRPTDTIDVEKRRRSTTTSRAGSSNSATSSTRRRTRTSARPLPADPAEGQAAEGRRCSASSSASTSAPSTGSKRCRTWTRRRIAFYGLSYGGKTAMRVPAIEKRYCLSICSADFNEWVGKNVSVDLDRSYMWTVEYDMYEFDLGNTFNYAEMAYLIAPRPFMVERGHDDGVGTDEMVAYEYAKVRYLYAEPAEDPRPHGDRVLPRRPPDLRRRGRSRS